MDVYKNDNCITWSRYHPCQQFRLTYYHILSLSISNCHHLIFQRKHCHHDLIPASDRSVLTFQFFFGNLQSYCLTRCLDELGCAAVAVVHRFHSVAVTFNGLFCQISRNKWTSLQTNGFSIYFLDTDRIRKATMTCIRAAHTSIMSQNLYSALYVSTTNICLVLSLKEFIKVDLRIQLIPNKA